jgi:hypothetical protein
MHVKHLLNEKEQQNPSFTIQRQVKVQVTLMLKVTQSVRLEA